MLARALSLRSPWLRGSLAVRIRCTCVQGRSKNPLFAASPRLSRWLSLIFTPTQWGGVAYPVVLGAGVTRLLHGHMPVRDSQVSKSGCWTPEPTRSVFPRASSKVTDHFGRTDDPMRVTGVPHPEASGPEREQTQAKQEGRVGDRGLGPALWEAPCVISWNSRWRRVPHPRRTLWFCHLSPGLAAWGPRVVGAPPGPPPAKTRNSPQRPQTERGPSGLRPRATGWGAKEALQGLGASGLLPERVCAHEATVG